MFDHILLALEDSPSGEMAALFAGALARRTGASVHVLHVNDRLLGGKAVDEAKHLVTRAVHELADSGVRASGSVRALHLPRGAGPDRGRGTPAFGRRHRARLEPPSAPEPPVLVTCA